MLMIKSYMALQENDLANSENRNSQATIAALLRWWQLPEAGSNAQIKMLQTFQQLVRGRGGVWPGGDEGRGRGGYGGRGAVPCVGHGSVSVSFCMCFCVHVCARCVCAPACVSRLGLLSKGIPINSALWHLGGAVAGACAQMHLMVWLTRRHKHSRGEGACSCCKHASTRGGGGPACCCAGTCT